MRHLFWKCISTKRFWEEVKKVIQTHKPTILEWNWKNVVFNNVVADKLHVSNLCAMVAKHVLYRYQCVKVKPNSELFTHVI